MKWQQKKWSKLVQLPYSHGMSIRYSNRLHDYSLIIPRCYKDVYSESFFPYTARHWNSLPDECFPLTRDLRGWFFTLTSNFHKKENSFQLFWISKIIFYFSKIFLIFRKVNLHKYIYCKIYFYIYFSLNNFNILY